ncbi:hypothetical protein ACVQ8P_06350 [Dellaglioa sp. BT-FLS60]
MRDNLVYIHIETVSHLILSYGISRADFITSIPKLPTNILSLNPVDYENEIDIATGFNTVTGEEDIARYLNKGTVGVKQNWIDFDSQDDLELITPREISEFLYLGHAFSHIQSPFYYKLQNDYVFLTLPNDALKIYYRYLNQFYNVFSKSVIRHVNRSYREKNGLFRRRPMTLKKVSKHIIEELMPLFIEGVALDFSVMTVNNTKISVPIYVMIDNVYQMKWHEPTLVTEGSKLVASLDYYFVDQSWHFVILNQAAFEDSIAF